MNQTLFKLPPTAWRAHRLAAALLCATALPAVADQPLWELGLGVAGLRLPHYRGSDQSYNLLLPLPYVAYNGRFLRADREGARAVLLEGERVDVDFSLAATAPTSSRNNDARRGLPDLAPTVEIGPNVNFRLASASAWKLDLRLPARLAVALQSRPRDVVTDSKTTRQ